jgi:predicted class III extradiol MEMO1 family dioxygenase
MGTRAASHSGSWYSDDRCALTDQLDQWLAQVPDTIEGLGSLPVPGARIIIAPYVLARTHSSLCLLIFEYQTCRL